MCSRAMFQSCLLLIPFIAMACGQSAAPITTNVPPPAGPITPPPLAKPAAQVQVWCGFMNYDVAVEGLKAGDTVKFVGVLSSDSTGQAVIVQSGQRFKEELPGVDYKFASAEGLVKAVAGNLEDAVKTYRGEEGKVPLMLVVEGTIESLNPSEYKIFLKGE